MWLIIQHSPSSHISFTMWEVNFLNRVSMRGFIKILAILSSDQICWILRLLHSISSHRKWWQISMCLLCPWNCGSWVNAIVPWLSLLRLNGQSGLNPSSWTSIWCQMTWHIVCESEMYSASSVGRAVEPCFFMLQAMAPPDIMNTLPKIDFWSFSSAQSALA